MATAASKARENVTVTGAEVQTTPIEQDVAGGTPPETALPIEPQVDPRQSALAALVSGEPDPVITADAVVAVDTSNVIDFGGRSKGIVLVSRYHQKVDGLFKSARKGDVIATTADQLARGVQIKALKKLGE